MPAGDRLSYIHAAPQLQSGIRVGHLFDTGSAGERISHSRANLGDRELSRWIDVLAVEQITNIVRAMAIQRRLSNIMLAWE